MKTVSLAQAKRGAAQKQFSLTLEENQHAGWLETEKKGPRGGRVPGHRSFCCSLRTRYEASSKCRPWRLCLELSTPITLTAPFRAPILMDVPN